MGTFSQFYRFMAHWSKEKTNWSKTRKRPVKGSTHAAESVRAGTRTNKPIVLFLGGRGPVSVGIFKGSCDLYSNMESDRKDFQPISCGPPAQPVELPNSNAHSHLIALYALTWSCSDEHKDFSHRVLGWNDGKRARWLCDTDCMCGSCENGAGL